MKSPEKSLTEIIYVHIHLKHDVLQTDDHTGRVFDFLRDPKHQYGRRMIDNAIRQQHPEGRFRYISITQTGFILLWEGSSQAARSDIDGLAKALLPVAEEVRRRTPRRSREVAITRELEYATGFFREPKYT